MQKNTFSFKKFINSRALKIGLVVLVVVVVGGVGFLADINGVDASDPLSKKIIDNLGITTGTAYPGVTDYNKPLPIIVGNVIKAVLGILVIIFFTLIIISGFRWMTAGGNEETVAKAKKYIGNAIIGLLVVMLSYVITFFMFDVIMSGAYQ